MGYAEFKNGLNKRAGIYTDAFVKRPIGNALSVPLTLGVATPFVGPANVIGDIKANLEQNDAQYEPDHLEKGGLPYIPGISSYNVAQTRKKSLREAGSKEPGSLNASETYGSIFSTPLSILVYGILGAGLGGVVGGITGGTRGMEAGIAGGALGGAVGGMMSPAVGALMAAITKTRTPEEHKAYASSPENVGRNWLIPGLSTYNYFKTMGRIHADQVAAEEAERARKQEEQAKVQA